MDRGAWERSLVARRVVAALLVVIACGLLALSMASAHLFFHFPGNGGSIGATIGLSTRQYLDHRRRGQAYAVVRALLMAGGVTLFLVGLGAAAAALAPFADARGLDVALLWMGAALFGGLAGGLAHRDPEAGLADLLSVWGIGLCFGGFVGIVNSSSTLLAGVGLLVGIPLLVYGITLGRSVSARRRAADAAAAA